MQFPSHGADRTPRGWSLSWILLVLPCLALLSAPFSYSQTTQSTSKCAVALQATETVLAWQTDVTTGVRLQWSNASPETTASQTAACNLEGSEENPVRSSVKNLYPGISLTRVAGGSFVGHQLILDRGSAPSTAAFEVVGTSALASDKFGNIWATTSSGKVRVTMPFAYQMNDTRRERVSANWVLNGSHVTLAVGSYDLSRPLMVNFSMQLPRTGQAAPLTKASPLVMPMAPVPPPGGATVDPPNPYLYGMYAWSSWNGTGYDGILFTLNRTDGSIMRTTVLHEPGGTDIYDGTGLASNPVDGVLYGLFWTTAASGTELFTIDVGTGTVTSMGDTGDSIVSLAFAADGTLYGVTGPNSSDPYKLLQIDPTTAATTVMPVTLNDCSSSPYSGGVNIAFNTDDGKLYEAACSPPVFRVIDFWSYTDIPWQDTTIDFVVGLTYFPVGQVFYASGRFDLYLYSVDASGSSTVVGNIGEVVRGLAFPAQDLRVLAVSPAPVTVGVGNNVTYTVTIANVGEYAMDNTTANLTFDADSAFVSATATQGSCTSTGCDLGSIAPNQIVTITVIITANQAYGGTASLEVEVAGSQYDSFPEDNYNFVLVPVLNASSTALGVDVNPAPYGGMVTFTATVTPSDATGTVTFLDGTATVGTCTLSSGVCSLSTDSLSAGGHNIVARYEGDSIYGGGTSAPLALTINSGTSTTALQVDVNPAEVGDTVTCTVTVAPVAPATLAPTGTVDIYDGAVLLETCTLAAGTCSYATDSLTPGSHDMTASYSGDANYTASTTTATLTMVIRDAVTVAILSSGSPTLYGEPITLDVTVTSGSGTPTGNVTIYHDGVAYGTGTLDGSGHASIPVTTLDVGTHGVFATYSGDASFSPGNSAPVSQTITQASTTTVVASNLSPATETVAVILTATVAPVAPGGGTPTGTVTFYDNAVSIGTGTLNASGQATLTTSSLTVGTHPITADYAGDTNFSASTTTSSVSQVIEAADFAVGGSGVQMVNAGASAPYTITVTPDPLPFTSAVTLSCANLPTGANCSFNPASVTPGSAPVTSTLTISTTSRTLAVARQNDGTVFAMWLTTSLVGLIGIVSIPDKRKRKIGFLLLLVVIGAIAMTSCGDGGPPPNPNGTPAGTHTITVTGTSGAVTHSTTITMVVN